MRGLTHIPHGERHSVLRLEGIEGEVVCTWRFPSFLLVFEVEGLLMARLIVSLVVVFCLFVFTILC